MIKYNFLLLILIFFGCSNSNKENNSFEENYTFYAVDSAGLNAFEGELTINKEDNRVNGTYEIKYVKYGVHYYSLLQNNKGIFDEELRNNAFTINMNPNIADNNIFVLLKLNDVNLSGTWSYSTLMGDVASGNIKAFKKSSP